MQPDQLVNQARRDRHVHGDDLQKHSMGLAWCVACTLHLVQSQCSLLLCMLLFLIRTFLTFRDTCICCTAGTDAEGQLPEGLRLSGA